MYSSPAAAVVATSVAGTVPRPPRPVGSAGEFGRIVVQLERRGEAQEFHAYVYPRLRHPRFRSPLVNVRNLALSGDDAWEALLARVLGRRKPIAFVSSWVRSDMLEAARRAMGAGCAVQWSPDGLCSVGIPGVVHRELGLGAVIADYREITAAAGPEAGERIASELRRIGYRAFADCLSFGDVESDGSPAGYARCGLLLGYPVESTSAFIGRVLRIDGCWTGAFGRFGRPPDDRARGLVERFLAGDGGPAEPWLRPYTWPRDPWPDG